MQCGKWNKQKKRTEVRGVEGGGSTIQQGILSETCVKWRSDIYANISKKEHSILGSSSANVGAQGMASRPSWPQPSVISLIIIVLISPWCKSIAVWGLDAPWPRRGHFRLRNYKHTLLPQINLLKVNAIKSAFNPRTMTRWSQLFSLLPHEQF